MKSLIVLFTALVIGGCISVPTLQNKQAQMEDFAWLELCQLLEDEADYRCMRLLPPIVVYAKLRVGSKGYYAGGDTIYIADDMEGTELTDVLIHEGIHYVHVQHQIIDIPGNAKEICWSENEAWTLMGLYWNEDNSKWWRSYRHCWQYYARTTYLRNVGVLYNEINDIIEDILEER